MRCPKCNQPLDDDTAFCGNCGTQIAPIFAQGATISEAGTALVRPKDGQNQVVSRYGPAGQMFQAPQPPTQYAPNPVQQGVPSAPPFVPTSPAPTPPPKGKGNGRVIFLVSIVVLLVIGVASGAFVFLNRKNPPPSPNGNVGAGTVSGTVTFTDSQNGHTNALKIIINGLNAAPAGAQYAAWLLNTGNEGVQPLGTLAAQQGQTFTLNFVG